MDQTGDEIAKKSLNRGGGILFRGKKLSSKSKKYLAVKRGN